MNAAGRGEGCSCGLWSLAKQRARSTVGFPQLHPDAVKDKLITESIIDNLWAPILYLEQNLEIAVVSLSL